MRCEMEGNLLAEMPPAVDERRCERNKKSR
jgi:hypothetical protein